MANEELPLCPNCEGALRIVEIVAPEDQKVKTRNTVAAGGLGAVAGGVLGAPAGPGGAAAGATIGAGLLSSVAAGDKEEVKAECTFCGEEHRVLVQEEAIPDYLKD